MKSRAGAMILIAVLGVATAGCERREADTGAGGELDRGRDAILKYGCTSCHSIPGVREGNSVGPSLESYARRPLVAETLPNTPPHLIIEQNDDGPLDNTPEFRVPANHVFAMGDGLGGQVHRHELGEWRVRTGHLARRQQRRST